MLAAAGIARVVAPRGAYDSEALLSLDLLGAGQIAGRGVLIVRGDGGRDLLAETLSARGARVECVACYRRVPPRDGASLVAMLRGKALDAVTLSSSEGLRNLLQLLDTGSRERLLDLPVFVSHRRIANEAAGRGLRRVVLTGPEDGGLIAGMCTYRWIDHE
jgi:uroporphyrinogen-III synthase